MHFQSKARNLPVNGETLGSLDTAGNDIIETNFRRWCRPGNCEVTGTHSWIDVQNLVVEGLVRDGEVLIRHIRNADNAFGYSLQILEPNFLVEEFNTSNPDKGNRIVMGVELNNFIRPEAFWCFQGPDHLYDDLSYGV